MSAVRDTNDIVFNASSNETLEVCTNDSSSPARRAALKEPSPASGQGDPRHAQETGRPPDSRRTDGSRRADETKRRPIKFEYLLSRNLITEDQLAAAIADARQRQVDVESVLIEQHRIPKAEIGKALSRFYNCPYVAYDPRQPLDPDLLANLKLVYLKKSLWVPLRREDGVVTVLVDDPSDLHKMDQIERLFGKASVRVVVGLRSDILQFLDSRPGSDVAQTSIADILGDLESEQDIEAVEESESSVVDDNDSSIIRLAHQIILDAYQARASDIHVEPSLNKSHTLIRFRVDGTCVEYQRIPGAYRLPLVARLKIMAELDISERRLPQDGKIRLRLSDRELDVRIATIPTVGGNEDVTLRLLSSQGEAIPIDKLALTGRNLRHLKSAAEKPYGLILCVGPTGSGKSTTLHAVLGHINKPDRKIWTAEDPVEITQAGLRQVQVKPHIGFTFAAAMRAFLRADPDVIMVGEMRDRETAGIGVEASLTGHLVLSTLHSNSAVEAVVRLLDLGLDAFIFADALLCVVGQRLVKRICPDCRESYRPSPEETEELVNTFGREQWDQLERGPISSLELDRGKGCAKCNKTGYRGRLPIHEVLVASDEIKRMIVTRASVAELLTQAREEGMTTLLQDGILKVLNGVTTFRQVKAAAIK